MNLICEPCFAKTSVVKSLHIKEKRSEVRKFLRIYAGGRKISGLNTSLRRGRPVVFRPLVTRSEVCYLGSWDQMSYLGRTMRRLWWDWNVNTLLFGRNEQGNFAVTVYCCWLELIIIRPLPLFFSDCLTVNIAMFLPLKVGRASNSAIILVRNASIFTFPHRETHLADANSACTFQGTQYGG